MAHSFSFRFSAFLLSLMRVLCLMFRLASSKAHSLYDTHIYESVDVNIYTKVWNDFEFNLKSCLIKYVDTFPEELLKIFVLLVYHASLYRTACADLHSIF